jgi:predicted DsbA family dithiol-disulfide isomerase
MYDERPRLYFDFVDPGSLLIRRRIATLGVDCSYVGFEMRPPPEPLVERTDPVWADYWRHATRALRATGIVPGTPALVPWTRMAHELVRHAAESPDADVAMAIVDRLFSAYIEEGRDIGRIDVIVPLAVEVGLDGTEARAVLDVDRWRDDVVRARAEASAAGVRGVPTLLRAGNRLEGVHDEETIRAFLEDD